MARDISSASCGRRQAAPIHHFHKDLHLGPQGIHSPPPIRSNYATTQAERYAVHQSIRRKIEFSHRNKTSAKPQTGRIMNSNTRHAQASLRLPRLMSALGTGRRAWPRPAMASTGAQAQAAKPAPALGAAGAQGDQSRRAGQLPCQLGAGAGL